MKYVVVFLICMVYWIVLSGKFDAVHLGMGVFSSLVVSYLTAHLLFDSKQKSARDRIRECTKVPFYALWLLVEIVKANLSLLVLAYSPDVKKRINPRVYSFKVSKLTDDFSKYVMGISITLVPGTVTIDIEGDEFIVHAITDEAAEGLPDPMESKVAAIFSKEESA